jgi:hypothetical protein
MFHVKPQIATIYGPPRRRARSSARQRWQFSTIDDFKDPARLEPHRIETIHLSDSSSIASFAQTARS